MSTAALNKAVGDGLDLSALPLVEKQKLKFSKIAKVLDKKYSTVYTTYLRAKKKGGES